MLDDGEGNTVSDRNPAIEVRDLVRVRGRKTQAFDGITFDVASGELSGCLGASGAGKTTTIRVLSALLGGSTPGLALRSSSRGRPSRRTRPRGKGRRRFAAWRRRPTTCRASC